MITIITPCSRPENLKYIPVSFNEFFPFAWIICYDLSKVNAFDAIPRSRYQIGVSGGVSGNLQRNKALESITDPEAWIYCLDDDNLLHPKFSQRLMSLFDDIDCDIITFDQELEDGTIRKGNDPRVGYIDQAQFLIRKSIHEDYDQDYNADGILISKLISKYPDRWLYIPETLSYYNRLQWKH